jgi:hypothetical protein
MGKKLSSLGFAVDDTHCVDRNHHEMLEDIEEFTRGIREDVTDIVFYYSGHGCSISKYSEIRVDSIKRVCFIMSQAHPRNL